MNIETPSIVLFTRHLYLYILSEISSGIRRIKANKQNIFSNAINEHWKRSEKVVDNYNARSLVC